MSRRSAERGALRVAALRAIAEREGLSIDKILQITEDVTNVMATRNHKRKTSTEKWKAPKIPCACGGIKSAHAKTCMACRVARKAARSKCKHCGKQLGRSSVANGAMRCQPCYFRELREESARAKERQKSAEKEASYASA